MKTIIFILVAGVTVVAAHRAGEGQFHLGKVTEEPEEPEAVGSSAQTGCSAGGQPCSGTGNCCSGYCRPLEKTCNYGNDGCSNGGQPCAGNHGTCCSGYCRPLDKTCNYTGKERCSIDGEPCSDNPGTCCGRCNPFSKTCEPKKQTLEAEEDEENLLTDAIHVTSGSKVTITIETSPSTSTKKIRQANASPQDSLEESLERVEKFSFTAKAPGATAMGGGGACCRCNDHSQTSYGGWGAFAKCVVGCVLKCLPTGGGGCSHGKC